MSKLKRGFSTTTYLKDDLELDTQVTLNGVQDEREVGVWKRDCSVLAVRDRRERDALDREVGHQHRKLASRTVANGWEFLAGPGQRVVKHRIPAWVTLLNSGR